MHALPRNRRMEAQTSVLLRPYCTGKGTCQDLDVHAATGGQRSQHGGVQEQCSTVSWRVCTWLKYPHDGNRMLPAWQSTRLSIHTSRILFHRQRHCFMKLPSSKQQAGFNMLHCPGRRLCWKRSWKAGLMETSVSRHYQACPFWLQCVCGLCAHQSHTPARVRGLQNSEGKTLGRHKRSPACTAAAAQANKLAAEQL